MAGSRRLPAIVVIGWCHAGIFDVTVQCLSRFSMRFGRLLFQRGDGKRNARYRNILSVPCCLSDETRAKVAASKGPVEMPVMHERMNKVYRREHDRREGCRFPCTPSLELLR